MLSNLSRGSLDAIQLPIGKRLKMLELAHRRIAISSRIREVFCKLDVQEGFRSFGTSGLPQAVMRLTRIILREGREFAKK
jgi:hypothetical protein